MSRPALRVIEGGRSEARARERRELLHELYRRHAPAVYARCRYLLRDESDAEDAMQEVFARAISNLERFRGEASPLTWLIRIATHHCLNRLRARRTRASATRLQSASAVAVAREGPELMEVRDRVRRHLARFDLETQRAAIHYHVDGMTLEEVARLLGRSVPTVRKRLARFARALSQETSSW